MWATKEGALLSSDLEKAQHVTLKFNRRKTHLRPNVCSHACTYARARPDIVIKRQIKTTPNSNELRAEMSFSDRRGALACPSGVLARSFPFPVARRGAPRPPLPAGSGEGAVVGPLLGALLLLLLGGAVLHGSGRPAGGLRGQAGPQRRRPPALLRPRAAGLRQLGGAGGLEGLGLDLLGRRLRQFLQLRPEQAEEGLVAQAAGGARVSL